MCMVVTLSLLACNFHDWTQFLVKQNKSIVHFLSNEPESMKICFYSPEVIRVDEEGSLSSSEQFFPPHTQTNVLTLIRESPILTFICSQDV